jgi:hypothetical protein
VEKGGRKKYITERNGRGMEEAPENGKESSNSVRANGMKLGTILLFAFIYGPMFTH